MPAALKDVVDYLRRYSVSILGVCARRKLRDAGSESSAMDKEIPRDAGSESLAMEKEIPRDAGSESLAMEMEIPRDAGSESVAMEKEIPFPVTIWSIGGAKQVLNVTPHMQIEELRSTLAQESDFSDFHEVKLFLGSWEVHDGCCADIGITANSELTKVVVPSASLALEAVQKSVTVLQGRKGYWFGAGRAWREHLLAALTVLANADLQLQQSQILLDLFVWTPGSGIVIDMKVDIVIDMKVLSLFFAAEQDGEDDGELEELGMIVKAIADCIARPCSTQVVDQLFPSFRDLSVLTLGRKFWIILILGRILCLRGAEVFSRYAERLPVTVECCLQLNGVRQPSSLLVATCRAMYQLATHVGGSDDKLTVATILQRQLPHMDENWYAVEDGFSAPLQVAGSTAVCTNDAEHDMSDRIGDAPLPANQAPFPSTVTADDPEAETTHDMEKALQESEEEALHMEQEQVTEAVLRSKADATPISNDSVVVFRLTGFSKQIRETLRASPQLAACRNRVEEAGCEVHPSFSPATFLVPVTVEHFHELGLSLKVHHVLALRGDGHQIEQALKDGPAARRPKLRHEDHTFLEPLEAAGAAAMPDKKPTSEDDMHGQAVEEKMTTAFAQEVPTLGGVSITEEYVVNGFIHFPTRSISEESSNRLCHSSPTDHAEMTMVKQRNPRRFKLRQSAP